MAAAVALSQKSPVQHNSSSSASGPSAALVNTAAHTSQVVAKTIPRKNDKIMEYESLSAANESIGVLYSWETGKETDKEPTIWRVVAGISFPKESSTSAVVRCRGYQIKKVETLGLVDGKKRWIIHLEGYAKCILQFNLSDA